VYLSDRFMVPTRHTPCLSSPGAQRDAVLVTTSVSYREITRAIGFAQDHQPRGPGDGRRGAGQPWGPRRCATCRAASEISAFVEVSVPILRQAPGASYVAVSHSVPARASFDRPRERTLADRRRDAMRDRSAVTSRATIRQWVPWMSLRRAGHGVTFCPTAGGPSLAVNPFGITCNPDFS
jgi:hypothetical protein